MTIITALILGIIIGWVIEWVIDWIYWRRRQAALAESLSESEAHAANLRINNTDLISRMAILEAEAGKSAGVKAELENKIAGLETEVGGLQGERDQLQAKIADLEGQGSGVGLAAAVGAVRLAEATMEVGAEPDTGAGAEQVVEEPGAVAAAVEAVEEPGAVAAAVEAAEEPDSASEVIIGGVPLSDADFTGNVDSSNFAEMAKFKYPLAYVEGIGPVYAEKLKAIGLISCLDFFKAGATRKGREELVEKSGISSKLILKWVNHIDLYRIKGIGSEYADLMEASGVDTVVELAQRNPANLFEKLNEVNAAKELVRKLPTAAQVEDWVTQAKGLLRVVTY